MLLLHELAHMLVHLLAVISPASPEGGNEDGDLIR
jgi:hypothetical protein